MSHESMPFDPGDSGRGSRWKVIAVLCFLGFLALEGSLIWHQVFLSEHYKEKEAYQTYRRVFQEGARGSIFDRNGVLLAGNQPLFSVGVFLNELRTDFRQRARDLRKQYDGETLPEGVNSITWWAREQVMQEKLNQVSRIIGRRLEFNARSFRNHYLRRLILPYELCAELTGDEYAKLVEALPPESPLQIFSKPMRYYPFGPVASHTIGYVGKGDAEEIEVDMGELEGIRKLNMTRQEGVVGLEKSLDAHLRGKLGWEVWSIDPHGFQVAKIDELKPEQGNDLYTTLDIDIQLIGEAAMSGKRGSIAAILVDSGEVLALVSEPNFDLNQFVPSPNQKTLDKINEQGAWLNRAIQGLYPPGSTFKTITALAALNDPTFDPALEVYCGPFYTIGNRRFPENRTRGHGYISLVDAIAVSSNVYFYQLGLRTGIQSIARQGRLLGLGETTGIELPFENRYTLMPDKEWKEQAGRGSWLPGDTANVSIGQGDLLVTPLQMARLTAAIARRSEYLPVTILKEKNTSIYTPSQLNIDAERFDTIIEGMERCVVSGTGRSMQLPNVSIAAKTGTAQVFVDGKEENLAWVIAFAPVQRPKIAVAVVVEDIGSSDPIYGGSTAGPLASAVIKEYIDKYGIE
jgi:penicillin-binding protein 2